MKNLKNLYGNEDIIKYAKWIDYDLMEADDAIEDLVAMGYDEDKIKEALEHEFDRL